MCPVPVKFSRSKNIHFLFLFCLISEILNACAEKQVADIPGILAVLLNAFLILTGAILPIIVLLDLDPIYVVFCVVYKFKSPLWFTIFRLIIVTWCTLEATRTIATILTPALTIFNATCSILVNIKRKWHIRHIIANYRQFQVLTECSRQGIRESAGMLMAAGFVIAVSSNYVVLTSFRKFPLLVYIM